MKNPSEPSLMGSEMSYMALLPGSLSNIQHSIQMLIPMKTTEITSAEKAMTSEVDLDMSVTNKKINVKGATKKSILRADRGGYENL